MLNSVLLSSADKIMGSKTPSQFTIVAHFISAADGSKFDFYPIFIDNIYIKKWYDDNYANQIDINLTVSPHDYALMQDQGQDLLCILTATYADKYGKQVFEPAPIQIQYNAIINNPRDIRKAIPDVHLYTEPSIPMSLQLLEGTVYDLRHTKINTVYPTSTVEQAIYAITQEFGIKKIHLIPPENTHVYDHIEIGSYQNISSIFGYLQSTCGVYTKGINAYIAGGTLFVYPAFETNPTYDKATLFYQVDTGRYAGSSVFHRLENDTVSIVINSQPVSTDLSISGSENIGTGFIFNRASRLTDGFTTIDSTEDAKFTEQPALSVSLVNPRTATNARNNMFHIHATDNPFPAMSEIISHQASLMEVKWDNADPFRFDPCQKIIYYYDHDETMVKKTGMIERETYVITRVQKTDVKSLFVCTGQLVLRLSPNESVTL